MKIKRDIRLAMFAGFMFGSLITMASMDAHRKTPVKVKPQAIKAVEVTPTPRLSWNDAIRQVFPADEAGRMIRICIAENKKQNQYATNHNTNGTYDYSWCQVNSVHKPNTMTDDEWKESLNDPVFHAKEVRRIWINRLMSNDNPYNAWTVYKYGGVR
jgi:hypothetical protein